MKKLESIIFYLLIFSIPVQSRLILHEWTRSFNQWTSAYIYGTDILFGILLVFWAARSSKMVLNSKSEILNSKQFSKFQIPNSKFFLILFFIISVVSIFNSHIIGLSLYQLIKLVEFIGFFFYLKSNFGKIFKFQSVLTVIIASGIFQSVVAIAQYIKQGGVGLRLLGESPLSVNANGVAVFIADGVKHMRAYGTAPHPNILAAWLFVAIFAFYFWYIYRDKNKGWITGEVLSLVVYAILLFAFFLTFSRVIIGLWVLGVLIRVFLVVFKKDFKGIASQIKSRILALTVASIITAAAFSMLFWPQVRSRIRISFEEEAVTQRIYYNKIAGSVATSHPFVGIGIGQFVPSMMAKLKYLPAVSYQPVHNIYLLIASETGFLGLGSFLMFLFFVFWRFIRVADFKKLYTFSFLIFTFSFLLVGLFDHFLWTSQQGSLVFWMSLALIASEPPFHGTGSID